MADALALASTAIRTYWGETQILPFTLTDATGAALAGSLDGAVTFRAAWRSADASPLIAKSIGSGVEVTDAGAWELRVLIDWADMPAGVTATKADTPLVYDLVYETLAGESQVVAWGLWTIQAVP